MVDFLSWMDEAVDSQVYFRELYKGNPRNEDESVVGSRGKKKLYNIQRALESSLLFQQQSEYIASSHDFLMGLNLNSRILLNYFNCECSRGGT